MTLIIKKDGSTEIVEKQIQLPARPIPEPKIFSKYKICRWFQDNNLLEQFMIVLNQNATMKFLWDAANELDQTDPNLIQFMSGVQQTLSLSNEQMTQLKLYSKVQ